MISVNLFNKSTFVRTSPPLTKLFHKVIMRVQYLFTHLIIQVDQHGSRNDSKNKQAGPIVIIDSIHWIFSHGCNSDLQKIFMRNKVSKDVVNG